MLARVACYFYDIIPIFIHLYFHIQKDGGVLVYVTQDPKRNITSIAILNKISSIVLLIVFYRYLFVLLILIPKLKIITAPKYL